MKILKQVSISHIEFHYSYNFNNIWPLEIILVEDSAGDIFFFLISNENFIKQRETANLSTLGMY